MASSQVEMEGGDTVQLKHLGFMRNLTINSFIFVSNLYDCAKENSGPLKSTVGTVENAVVSVAGPVYEKFKDVPTEFLVFLDNKVDEASNKIGVMKAKSMVNNASKVAQDLREEAMVSGPVAAISHAATMSKHFTVTQLGWAWCRVNRSSDVRGTVAQLSEKYNEFVREMAAKWGYGLFGFVPLLVPVEEMVKEGTGVEKEDEGSSSESVEKY